MTPQTFGAIVTWVDRAGGPGPLSGLRVGVKDVIAVQGAPRLCGAPGVVDTAPQPRDAESVARLVADGARIVATTTTHQLSYGVTTPGVENPAAAGHIAGGSSGGSAAALAAGIVDGALGTDTAGSVRIPAACCGVMGLKTTDGIVPRNGLQPLSPTFDTIGPLARDVQTLAALFASLAAQPVDLHRPDAPRVGILHEAWHGPLEESVRQAWRDCLDVLEAAGATTHPVSIPQLDECHRAAGRIVAAEAAKVHRQTLLEHRDALAPDVRGALDAGTTLSNEKVLAARRTAAMLRDRLGGVFRAVDVLVLPVLPCEIPPAGAQQVVIEGREEPITSALTRLVDVANVAGVPAGTVPWPRADGALPMGMQIVGAWRAESSVLSMMDLLAAITR